jgi:1-aminocyclopropane-1-carboxylate deaminase/D-cysteine desulfhydrase-like pyridoxal-dependent ACC family enzyme
MLPRERLPFPPSPVALGDFPSPVEQHPALAAALGLERLVVKRDDLCGSPFGGNKLRALEWLLPAAGPAILTMGGYGSTWCAALASAAARRGQRVHAALFPQPWSPSVSGLLSTTLAEGRVVLAPSRRGMPLALARAWLAARQSGAVTWMPAGGATPRAILGSVSAGLEFARQVEGDAARLQAIVVPLGSGGTAAGLLVGAWVAGWEIEICAVRVTDPWFANRRRVLRLAMRTLRLLRGYGLDVRPGVARLRVLGEFLGAGYGCPTEAGRRAAALAATSGIALDLTYGAKAFASLVSLGTSFRRLCFWHTFDGRLLSLPSAEHPALREARAHAESLWPQQKSI